jgi:hypothetical protein
MMKTIISKPRRRRRTKAEMIAAQEHNEESPKPSSRRRTKAEMIAAQEHNEESPKPSSRRRTKAEMIIVRNEESEQFKPPSKYKIGEFYWAIFQRDLRVFYTRKFPTLLTKEYRSKLYVRVQLVELFRYRKSQYIKYNTNIVNAKHEPLVQYCVDGELYEF